MKSVWLALAVLSGGCAALDSITPATRSELGVAIENAIDESLTASSPEGIDFGSATLGGAVVSLVGFLADYMKHRRKRKEATRLAHEAVALANGKVDKVGA